MKRFLILLVVVIGSAIAAEAVDFKKDVRPIFKEHCYECHSKETGKEKAGYIFDDVETLKLDIQPKGIIVPNEPGESYLLEVLTMNVDEKAHMPPKKQLSDREIATIRDWIAAGASLETVAPGSLPARPAAPVMMEWVNAEGVKIKAGFVRLDGETVILKMPTNGQEVPYPLAKLSAESQAQAKQAGEKN
jgi:hypothetical protein